MTEKKIDATTQPEQTSASESEAVSEGRAAARRRFLTGSAAAGAILTFVHQRSYATTKTMFVSSTATCTSLHGALVYDKKGNPVTQKDSLTGKTQRYQCNVNI
jgi:hypothetical protein